MLFYQQATRFMRGRLVLTLLCGFHVCIYCSEEQYGNFLTLFNLSCHLSCPSHVICPILDIEAPLRLHVYHIHCVAIPINTCMLYSEREMMFFGSVQTFCC